MIIIPSTETTYSDSISIAIGIATVVKIVMDFSDSEVLFSSLDFLMKDIAIGFFPTSVGHVLKKTG